MPETLTGELNYPGLVNPEIGQGMGPDLKGRVWRVVGSIYDTVANRTTVTVETQV